MSSSGANVPGRDVRHSRVRLALVHIFATACLVWVFHDVHPRQVLAAMSIAHWRFVTLAIIIDILTYVLQGMRWKLLLTPVGRLSSLRATQGIYAGLLVNELVPLRFGEVVRAFLVSRWLSLRFTMVLPSMVVERFLDALWLAAGIGVAAVFLPLPEALIKASDVLGGIVLLATLLFLWLVFRREQNVKLGNHSFRSPILRRFSHFALEFAGGLREIGASHRLYLAALLSAGMLACQALALWFMLVACSIELPLWAGAVVLLVIRLGTAIPNAPANLGSFQLCSVLALTLLFGVEKTVAAGFSISCFLALTVPLWIIGLLAISRTGMTLATIRLGAANTSSLRN